jgi:hypothetical protein
MPSHSLKNYCKNLKLRRIKIETRLCQFMMNLIPSCNQNSQEKNLTRN